MVTHAFTPVCLSVFISSLQCSSRGWLAPGAEGPALSATPVFTGGHVGILNQAKMSCYNFYAVYFRSPPIRLVRGFMCLFGACCAVKDAVECECLLNRDGSAIEVGTESLSRYPQ